MTEETEQERPTLGGEEALSLWCQGRDVWNRWIAQHPGWNISFAGVDFSTKQNDEGNLSFAGYHFGDGNVDFSFVHFGDVNFSKASFGDGNVNFYESSFGDVDFSKASFGDGNVVFSKASFGDGDVNFSGITFGKGDVNFYEATFGNSNVDFSFANFDDGDADFSYSTFGNGNFFFSHATFGNGDVDFSHATFADSNIYFSYTTFDNGHLDFSHTNFGNGNVVFSGATFGDGNVDFYAAALGDGNVNFSKVIFGNGDVYFSEAIFGDGDLNFSEAAFGGGEIKFSQALIGDLLFTPRAIEPSYIRAEGLSIKGRAIFTLPSSAAKLKSFNLHSASFDGPLTLKGDLSIIPDLRATRYSHQVDLSALTVKLRRRWQKPGRRTDQLRVKAVSQTGIISRLAYKFARKKWINLRHFNKLRRHWKHHCWPIKLSLVAEDPQDGARLRRLKEIAETNKDHQAALRFSADENRAKRWIETSWFGSVLDMAFSFFSNYGQSILRPSFWLGVIFALSMYAYKAKQLPKLATDGWADWAQAALLSASNSLPFLPQSRELRTGALKALYDTDSSSYVDTLMITQGVLSFVFLFLIGLGLRNRFRL